ncbi:hypothetical protein [Candidatus Berkiella aquae]|uniref:Uncharacterized protein n=1 Tax=Candidatus Berkiella aquae TaxID=295108 RepID=A0A0Q9YG83_9GAMM|nr:hypothetical protein [Candidatus Berkiella aquae]MCS5709947.1 hypothetical protein [Candidatus Berkiella aquae]
MPRSAKTLQIAHIVHTGIPAYEMITINGMPFYQSSGNSSTYANTWFPFFGLLEKKIGPYPIGLFLKAFSTELPQNVVQRIRELFPSYGSADAGAQLPLRFWRVPCLLISSTLGGGLWDTDNGRELKAFLQQQYPAYYQAEPRLAIKPATARLSEPKAVNTWLCRQANIKNIKALAGKYPKTANDLISLLKPARKVNFAELDTQNGKRLFNLRNKLREEQKRPAPVRNDQEKPLKRFLKKNPELKNQIATPANRFSTFTYTILALCLVGMGLCMSPWPMMGLYVMGFSGAALLCEKLHQSRQEAQTPLVSPSSTTTLIEKTLPTSNSPKATVPHSSAKATTNQETIKSILRKRRL